MKVKRRLSPVNILPTMFAITSGRITFLACVTCFAVLLAGCGSNSAPDTSKVAVLDPTKTSATSSSLLDAETRLNKVYDTDMSGIANQIEPGSKALVDKLTPGPADVKSQLAKDHKMFTDGIDAAKKALTNLSGATSNNVDAMEHDKYVNYYTAVGELITAQRDEYQAFLDYEAKPNDKTRLAILGAARVARGKELAYTTVKR